MRHETKCSLVFLCKSSWVKWWLMRTQLRPGHRKGRNALLWHPSSHPTNIDKVLSSCWVWSWDERLWDKCQWAIHKTVAKGNPRVWKPTYTTIFMQKLVHRCLKHLSSQQPPWKPSEIPLVEGGFKQTVGPCKTHQGISPSKERHQGRIPRQSDWKDKASLTGELLFDSFCVQLLKWSCFRHGEEFRSWQESRGIKGGSHLRHCIKDSRTVCMKHVHHRFVCLNSWFPAGGAVWGGNSTHRQGLVEGSW